MGFLDRATDSGATGAMLGGTLGFVLGSVRYAGRRLDLALMLKIGGVGAYFTLAGGAVGVFVEGFAHI